MLLETFHSREKIERKRIENKNRRDSDADIRQHQTCHELSVLLIGICILTYLSRVYFFFVLNLYFSFLVSRRLCGEISESVSLLKAWYCTEK